MMISTGKNAPFRQTEKSGQSSDGKPGSILDCLNVHARTLLGGSLSFPFQLIDDEGNETLFYPLDKGHLTVNLPAGNYQARIHTPWGQIFLARGIVKNEEVQLNLKAAQFLPEALPWLLFRPEVLSLLPVESVSSEEEEKHLQVRFWTQKSGRWVLVNSPDSGLSIRSKFHRVCGQIICRLIVASSELQPLWARIKGDTVPAQIVALPPGFGGEILILPEVSDQTSLRVTALSAEPVSRALSAFLACSDNAVVEYLLAAHAELPFEPQNIFFHLMRLYCGNFGAGNPESSKLCELARELPDVYIAAAWQEMFAEKPVLKEVRRLLLKGAQVGVPLWPASLKQLSNGLDYFLHGADDKDKDVLQALRSISRFVLAVRPAVATRFFALEPGRPLFAPPLLTQDSSSRQRRFGKVISAKMVKTIVVEAVVRKPHPKFLKIIKKSKKFYVHDEYGYGNKLLGKIVEIRETRPLSKLKRWRLIGLAEEQISVGEKHRREQRIANGLWKNPWTDRKAA